MDLYSVARNLQEVEEGVPVEGGISLKTLGVEEALKAVDKTRGGVSRQVSTTVPLKKRAVRVAEESEEVRADRKRLASEEDKYPVLKSLREVIEDLQAVPERFDGFDSACLEYDEVKQRYAGIIRFGEASFSVEYVGGSSKMFYIYEVYSSNMRPLRGSVDTTVEAVMNKIISLVKNQH